MAASIFNGNFVKLLKDQLKFNNTARILTGTDDPTVVAKDAEQGSVYLRTGGSGGTAYIKTDAGSTVNWNALGSAPAASEQDLLQNLGLATSVSSNALTVALKLSDGSTDPSGGNPARIAFRSSTLTSGAYLVRNVTGALSVVVSSGSTLGHADAVAQNIYIYALDNAGTVELAVSSVIHDEGALHSTTAEGGAGGADSNRLLYSTTARTGVAIRLIGMATSTQTTAGTWAANVSALVAGRFNLPPVHARYHTNSTMTVNNTNRFHPEIKDIDTHNAVVTGSGTWQFTVPKTGFYAVHSVWFVNAGNSLIMFATGFAASFPHYISGLLYNSVHNNGSTVVYLEAGETFWLDNGSASNTTLSADALDQANWISITEIPGGVK